MLRCPACHRHAVPIASAWRSSLSRPAHCRRCAATCYVRSLASGMPLLAGTFSALAGAGLAVALQSVAILAAGLVAAGLAYALLWRRIRPVPAGAMSAPSPSKVTTGLALLDFLPLFFLWK